jgi:uncharacterized protein YaeQ
MALKATICKAEVTVSDLDRGYFGTHAVTLAKHPSETDERMMVRLLAFALHADEHLAFGRGLSAEDEADLVLQDLTGAIDLWIDVGLPDERDLRKASGRARHVVLYAYGGRAVRMWWEAHRTTLARLPNFTAYEVPEALSAALAAQAQRNLEMTVTVQDGHALLNVGEANLEFALVPLDPAA